jgi:hypothetical protein
MRAFLVCYVLGVLALNFRLENPVFFYLALTAFPVTVYLTLSRSHNSKKQLKEEKVETVNEKKAKTVFETSDDNNNFSSQ